MSTLQARSQLARVLPDDEGGLTAAERPVLAERSGIDRVKYHAVVNLGKAAGVAFDKELQTWLGSAVPERTPRQFASTLSRLRAAEHGAEAKGNSA